MILTCDPDVVRDFWLFDYVPEVLETEARRYPSLPRLSAALGGNVKVLPVPIPKNCFDGFNEAYYARPEMFLRAPARLACSAWSFVPEQDPSLTSPLLRLDTAQIRAIELEARLRDMGLFRSEFSARPESAFRVKHWLISAPCP